MTEVKRPVGRPSKPLVQTDSFNFQEYYRKNAPKFRTEGLIKYYRKVTNTSNEELKALKRLGLTPEAILVKLKEKVLVAKIQKLHTAK